MFADEISGYTVHVHDLATLPFFDQHPPLYMYLLLHTVYSVAPPEVVDPLVCDGFVDELVEVLEHRAGTVNVS